MSTRPQHDEIPVGGSLRDFQVPEFVGEEARRNEKHEFLQRSSSSSSSNASTKPNKPAHRRVQSVIKGDVAADKKKNAGNTWENASVLTKSLDLEEKKQ